MKAMLKCALERMLLRIQHINNYYVVRATHVPTNTLALISENAYVNYGFPLRALTTIAQWAISKGNFKDARIMYIVYTHAHIFSFGSYIY